MFNKNGYIFNPVLAKGIVEIEGISKKDYSAFTDSELDALVQANSVGGKWQKKVLNGSVSWTRDDGALAFCAGNILVLESHKFYESNRH